MPIRYITILDMLTIHSDIIDGTGGMHGVREAELLVSIVQRPQTTVGGKEQFKTIHTKAAVYLESIAQYHVFVDGNKRTAFAVATRFLYLNGYEMTAPSKAVESFMVKVVTGKKSIKDITQWLKEHSHKV